MMNCTMARRYLYAFADGELPVKENCEVLDHLKMCPECSRIASEQHELRIALRRSLNRVPVPEGLAERIRLSLESPAETPAPVGRGRVWRFIVPTAAAASLALAATTYWMIPRGDESAPVAPIKLPERGDVAIQQIVKTHDACSEKHAAHQGGDLPTSPDALATALEKHFNGLLDITVPDFAADGYTLESANYCGFTKNSGAHMVYVSKGKNPRRISFFVVPRWSSVDDCGYYKGVGDEFLRKFAFPHMKSTHSVVAWHDNQTTYVCVGRIDMQKLIKMVEPVRAAMLKRAAAGR